MLSDKNSQSQKIVDLDFDDVIKYFALVKSMPEAGSPNQRATLETSTDVISETLIFTPDFIKAENFNPEDHVILVVPESSDLVTTEGADGETTGFVIPASEGDVSVAPYSSELRETIKSNFLVIAKLLPSKSPPPLVPFAAKKENETVEEDATDEGVVLSRLTSLPKTLLPKPAPTKTPRPPKTPRQSGSKSHSAVKPEGPEIFGKMFPASYNEVLWKQIREIIYFKCGKDATDDTVVAAGITCPHCRKKPSTLNQLKEHLQNCHTYSTSKRKSSCPSGKNVIKKMLYRCQYCDEAFISQGMRDSHECSLAAKPLEHLGDITKSHPNTCGICFQDFGSRSELSIHQEVEHEMPEGSKVTNEAQSTPKVAAPPPSKPTLPSISKYVSCQVCNKKVSVSILDEHLKRHQELTSDNVAPPLPSEVPKKCGKCASVIDPDSDTRTCGNCQDSDGDERAICPICDIELDSAALDQHAKSHYTPVSENPPKGRFQIGLCANCGEEFKVHPMERAARCKNCR